MTEKGKLLYEMVRDELRPEILRPEFQIKKGHRFFGQCFHATISLYVLLEGKSAGYHVRKGIDEKEIVHETPT